MIFIEEIIRQEADWRIGEISILKTLPFHSNLSKNQTDVLRKHSIPAMYSLWEGFVKDAFRIYAQYLNSLKLTIDNISPKLLTHAINMVYLKEFPQDFNKQINLVDALCRYVTSEIVLPTEIPMKSNVNYEVISNILNRFELESLSEKPFKDWLNKLLNFRNRISHGDFSAMIGQHQIDEFSQWIITLMDEILSKILDGYNNRTYLKIP